MQDEYDEDFRLMSEFRQGLAPDALARFESTAAGAQLLVARLLTAEAYDHFFAEFSGKRERWQCRAGCFDGTEQDSWEMLAQCKKFCGEKYASRQRKLLDVHYFTLRLLEKKFKRCADLEPAKRDRCLATALIKANRRLTMYWPEKISPKLADQP